MQEKRTYSRPQKFTRHRFPKELAKSRHIASNLEFLSVVAGAWNPCGVSFWGRVQGHATVLPRNENGEQFGKTNSLGKRKSTFCFPETTGQRIRNQTRLQRRLIRGAPRKTQKRLALRRYPDAKTCIVCNCKSRSYSRSMRKVQQPRICGVRQKVGKEKKKRQAA